MRPALSVALPLYATRDAVPELIDRLRVALAGLDGVELVFVDDACPQRSYEAVAAHEAGDLSVVLLRHERNHGQHSAVVTALRAASGELCAVMDADLQDAPEDLARLVDALVSCPSYGAVAAGRRGHYQSRARELSGRAFRRAMQLLSGGVIPADAGMFVVMTREARDAVVALDDPGVHPVAALGRLGVRIRSVPVVRHRRPTGSTGYPTWKRATTALRALVVVTPLYRVQRAVRRPPAPVAFPVTTIDEVALVAEVVP